MPLLGDAAWCSRRSANAESQRRAVPPELRSPRREQAVSLPAALPLQPPATRSRPELISVILTTYNAPKWLEKVLWGYACQSHRAFELVLADDGSGQATYECVDRMREQTGLRIRHVWHEDRGFRKCAILNRAICASRGDYLVFSDGDCIPRSDFLAQHHRFAEPGRFLSGGYYKLPLSISRAIDVDDIRSGRAFRYRWLRRQGLPLSHRCVRLLAGETSAAWLERLTTTRPTWNGNNASGWTEDVLRVNGFDERMRYGGLDRELGERLENSGIRGKQVRFHAICLHLDHPRGYANADDWKRNDDIRKSTRCVKRTRTEHGIEQAA